METDNYLELLHELSPVTSRITVRTSNHRSDIPARALGTAQSQNSALSPLVDVTSLVLLLGILPYGIALLVVELLDSVRCQSRRIDSRSSAWSPEKWQPTANNFVSWKKQDELLSLLSCSFPSGGLLE